MPRFQLLLLWLGFLPGAFAQKTATEYAASYQAARNLLKAAEFEKARLAFGPLTQQRYAYPQAPYAHYFYALASLKTDRVAEAKGILRQLMERFPSFEKADDARYLLADALFRDEDYNAALDLLKQIDDPALRADANTLEDYHLRRAKNLPVLKGLYLTYPDDRLVAYALVELIQRTSTEKADLELSDRITNRYGVRQGGSLPPSATNQPSATTSTAPTTPPRKTGAPKSFYNVGVLFPFQVDDLDERDRPVRSTQFALDLYNGMRLAAKRLQTEGVLINLFAYDVENNARQMTDLVKNGPFQQMDLLVGPLYAEPYRIAQTWATERDVPLINPISTNRRLVETAPNVYLAQPSLDQQAEGAAQFARRRFGTAPAVVFYGIDRNDSLLAAAYVGQLKILNVPVLAFQRNSMGSTETVTAAAPLWQGKRVGHVFVASSQKGSGPAFLTALGRNRLGDVPTLLLAEGFDRSTMSASQFGGREVYLVDPNFVNDESPDVQEFQKAYMNRYNVPPSSFAYWGYDTMLFFGRTLGKNGPTGLKEAIRRPALRNGYTLGGFDYAEANDNNTVPIVAYENFKFIPVK